MDDLGAFADLVPAGSSQSNSDLGVFASLVPDKSGNVAQTTVAASDPFAELIPGSLKAKGAGYGPLYGETYHDAMVGPLGPLGNKDVALSPDYQKEYPLGSFVMANGRGPYRVADHSYISPGKPNTATIEFRDTATPPDSVTITHATEFDLSNPNFALPQTEPDTTAAPADSEAAQSISAPAIPDIGIGISPSVERAPSNIPAFGQQLAANLQAVHEAPPIVPKQINPIYQMGREAEAVSNLLPPGRLQNIGQAIGGGAQGIASAASSLTTPENIGIAAATLPLGGTGVAAKVAQTALAAYFEAQAVHQLPQQWEQFKAEQNPARKAEILTGIVTGLGLPVAGVAHIATAKANGLSDSLPKGGDDTNVTGQPIQAGSGSAPKGARPVGQEPSQGGSGQGRVAGPETSTGEAQRGSQASARADRPSASYPSGPESATGNAADRSATAAAGNGNERPVSSGAPSILDVAKRRNDLMNEGALLTQQADLLRQQGIRPPNTITDRLSQISDELTGISGASDSTVTTGVANRILEEEFKQDRLEEAIQPGGGRSWQDMVDLGRKLLNEGADPYEIARRFKRTGRLSPEDFTVLRAERERLALKSNEAAAAVRQNPGSAELRQKLKTARERETAFVRDVVQPAKTSTSDIFRGMQNEAPVDATTFEGLRRAVIDGKGREPTPREAKSLEQLAAGVKQAQAREVTALRKLSERIDRELPRGRTPTIDEMRNGMKAMMDELLPC